MLQINAAALLRECRSRNREEMMLWLRNAAGRKVTKTEFDNIMRKYLPLEAHFQADVMTFIRENYPGSFVWKAAAGPYCRQGLPDVCAIVCGHFFGFEIKRPYIGKLSKIQERTMMEIEVAGGTAAVVSFGTQAKEVIEKWLNLPY